MTAKKEAVPVKLRRDQINRLNLLRAALAEKMGKEFTLSDIISAAVDNFLESK